MRVKFTDDYDHEWPSRAVTNFPKGHEDTVKAEVAEAAIAAGKAVEVTRRKAEPTAAAPDKPRAKRGRKPKPKAESTPAAAPVPPAPEVTEHDATTGGDE